MIWAFLLPTKKKNNSHKTYLLPRVIDLAPSEHTIGVKQFPRRYCVVLDGITMHMINRVCQLAKTIIVNHKKNRFQYSLS